MQYPQENQELLRALGVVRDNRTRLQKLDDWFVDRPFLGWISGALFVAVMIFLALNLAFGWVDLRWLVG